MKKRAYRFRDLLPGDRFYIDTYPYDVLTVASVWDGRNTWRGEEKIYLNPNVPVDPIDKRKAARNRLSLIRKVTRELGISLDDLKKSYANAVFNQKTGGTESAAIHNRRIVEALPPEIRAALAELDLIFYFSLGNPWDHYPMIAGSFFRPFI